MKKESIIANQIMQDYWREKYYKNKKRKACKQMDCKKCQFFKICTESESQIDV